MADTGYVPISTAPSAPASSGYVPITAGKTAPAQSSGYQPISVKTPVATVPTGPVDNTNAIKNTLLTPKDMSMSMDSSTPTRNSGTDTLGFLKSAFVDPEQVRTPFQAPGETQTLPYGGKVIASAADIGSRLVELIPKAITQFASNVKATADTLSGGGAQPLRVPFNAGRLGLPAGNTVQDSGTKMANDFSTRMDQNPDHPILNGLMSILTGPVQDVFDADVAGSLVNGGSEGILNKTGYNRQALDTLNNLGINPDELKLLDQEKAAQLVSQRANAKAQEILTAHADELKTTGKLPQPAIDQLNELGQQVKSLGGEYQAKQGIQLNQLGNFLRDSADTLTRPIDTLGTEAPFRTAPSEEEKLPGYRKTPGQAPAMGLSIEQREPVGFGKENTPEFQGYQDLSTTVLNKLEGRTTVSKQFISDLTNSPELKQAERDVVRSVLESYPDNKAIPIQEFADKVKAELLPLERGTTANDDEGIPTQYEHVALPSDLRGPIANYTEHVYESPVPTSAGGTHFDKDVYPNYFGHTRVEDLPGKDFLLEAGSMPKEDVENALEKGQYDEGDTRRIIEVQSDLYQKGGLENEINSPNRSDVFSKSSKDIEKELAPLKQYSNPTAHFRMVREELKQAAIDGKTKVQFPTGETAMKIEGLGQNEHVWMDGRTETILRISDLKVGKIIDNDATGTEWVVTDVLGDGKFKAVPKGVWDKYKDPMSDSARVNMGGRTETFDISGKIDTSNPIYKFYEKDLGKYLTNKYGATRITDPQGVSWYEVNVPKEMAKQPVTAFKKKIFPAISGPKASPEEVTKLIRDLIPAGKMGLIIDPDLLANTGAIGRMKSPPDALKDSLRPLMELYEENGKVGVRTAYHEAFHYMFRHIIGPEERASMLAEASKEMGAFRNANYWLDGYRGSKQERVEEYMADEYAKYKADEAGYKGPLTKIMEAINRIVKKIVDAIKKFYESVKAIPNQEGGFIKNPLEYDPEEIKPTEEKQVPEQNEHEKELQNLITQRDAHFEALEANPAKSLSKYANSNGELPEVLGEGGKFGKTGDQIVNDLGFPDSESARALYQNYKLQQKRLTDLNTRIAEQRKLVALSKAEDKDAKSFANILERNAKKTDRDLNAMEKALKAPETEAAMKARKLAAADRMAQIIAKTYGSIAPIDRETPEWVLQATEKSYAMTEEEHRQMGLGDPTKLIHVDASTPVKQKVGIVDYFRTPDRVMKKIGMEGPMQNLRLGYEAYLRELPLHLDLIKDWGKKMKAISPKSNERIFDYLDGQFNRDYHSGKVVEPLRPSEKAIATDIREYLQEWADRLGLPADSKISHYITHIFGLSQSQKEFDEDMAKIIRDRIPGSVYDPFLEERLGKKGYIRDTIKALDAYAKRAVRKANMDPALEHVKDMATHLEDSQEQYVKRYADRINMRPTEWDNLLDNTIKQLVGYKFGGRPTAFLTGTMRKWVSRQLLGFNINNAVKNLTQGVNTFAKLGPKYTTIGYTKMMSNVGSDELKSSGILRQNIVQDQTVSAVKTTMAKIDKGLYVLHGVSEYINRAAAYWGAKAQAIDQGATEKQAMEYARKMSRDTQFNYGSIDTPLALSGDIAKTILQFMSYPVKQTEFVAEMLQGKEWGQLIRYILASIGIVYSLGQIFNIKGRDFVPLSFLAPSQVGGTMGASKFGNPPTLALPEAIWGVLVNLPGSVDTTTGPRGGRSGLDKSALSILKNLPIPFSLQAQKIYSSLNPSKTANGSSSSGKKALAF